MLVGKASLLASIRSAPLGPKQQPILHLMIQHSGMHLGNGLKEIQLYDVSRFPFKISVSFSYFVGLVQVSKPNLINPWLNPLNMRNMAYAPR